MKEKSCWSCCISAAVRCGVALDLTDLKCLRNERCRVEEQEQRDWQAGERTSDAQGLDRDQLAETLVRAGSSRFDAETLALLCLSRMNPRMSNF